MVFVYLGIPFLTCLIDDSCYFVNLVKTEDNSLGTSGMSVESLIDNLDAGHYIPKCNMNDVCAEVFPQ